MIDPAGDLVVAVYPFAVNHGRTRHTIDDALAVTLWPPRCLKPDAPAADTEGMRADRPTALPVPDRAILLHLRPRTRLERVERWLFEALLGRL